MSDGEEVKVDTNQDQQRQPSWQENLWRLMTPKPIENAIERMYRGQAPPVLQARPDAQGIQRYAPQIVGALTSPFRDFLNTAGRAGSFLSGRDYNPSMDIGSQIFGATTPTQTAGEPAKQRQVYSRNQQEIPTGLTTSEWVSQNMGTFDESPYRNYMNFLATQDEETMARINAMYNQLAESAQGNMERIGDIYGSAQMTSGDVYGGSAQAIEDAYGSAQQQAADQMSRLGIEAAAPAVINPMALSQAEAVAGIEAAGAGSLDALTRYGASAQDFGSQMGQVGQQQGLEVSSQILRDMQQRQADAMFQMEQARANFNPYANLLQQLEAEQMINDPILRAEENERQRGFEMMKLDIERRMQFDEALRRDVQRYMDSGLEYDDAVAAVINLTGYTPYGQ